MKNFILIIFLLVPASSYADYSIEISISEQRLYLTNNEVLIRSYPISSSAFGEGQIENSFMTPLGTVSYTHLTLPTIYSV